MHNDFVKSVVSEDIIQAISVTRLVSKSQLCISTACKESYVGRGSIARYTERVRRLTATRYPPAF